MFAVSGFDVLYSTYLRRLLVEYCQDEQLKSLCSALAISCDRKRFDVAIEVAKLSWRFNSNVVESFQRVFGIDDEFLPSPPAFGVSSRTIRPRVRLPDLFDYQHEVKSEVLAGLARDESANLLVQLPTGAGKTRTLLSAVVEHINDKLMAGERITILWVAHTQELCLQAYESFENLWREDGVRPHRLSKAWGDAKLKTNDI